MFEAVRRALSPPPVEKPDPEAAIANLRQRIPFIRSVRTLNEGVPWRILVSSAHKELLEHCYRALTEEERLLVAAWQLIPQVEN